MGAFADAAVAWFLEDSRAAFGDAYCLLIRFNAGRDTIAVWADAVVGAEIDAVPGAVGVTAYEAGVADEAGGTVDDSRFEEGVLGMIEVLAGTEEEAAGIVEGVDEIDEIDEDEGVVDEAEGMEEEAAGAGADATTGADAVGTGAFAFMCEPAGASFPVKNHMPATDSATAGSVQNQNNGVRRFLPPLTARSTLAQTASEGLNESSSNFCCTSFSNLGSCIRLIFGDG